MILDLLFMVFLITAFPGFLGMVAIMSYRYFTNADKRAHSRIRAEQEIRQQELVVRKIEAETNQLVAQQRRQLSTGYIEQ